MKVFSAILICFCFIANALGGSCVVREAGGNFSPAISEGSFVYKFSSSKSSENTAHAHEHDHSPGEPAHEHEHDQNHSHKVGVAQAEFSSFKGGGRILSPRASKQKFASYAASFSGSVVTPTLFRPPIA